MKKLPCLVSFAAMFCVSLFFSCSSDAESPLLTPDDLSSSSGSSSGSPSGDLSSSSSSPSDLSSSSGSPSDLSSSSQNNSTLSGSSNGNFTQACNSPVSCYGKLQASGNKIVGSKTGTAVQVRGVSLGWSNTGWNSANFFKDYTINAMVDGWKAEIIRVPMGHSYNTTGDYDYVGSYKDDPANNMNRVKEAINAAIAKGVYVIIDWHSHNAHLDLNTSKGFFESMARDYGDKDNVIFEIYNEPNCSDGSKDNNCAKTSWAQITTYANSIISTIRQYSNNLILVGTPEWDQKVDVGASSPLSDPIGNNNLAYVFHFYAKTHSVSSFGTRIDNALANRPVFVSEYGTVSADGNGSHDKTSSDQWMIFLNERKISYCAWHVNNQNEASAFFNPTFTPSASAAWTTTSNMTASGQYIYNNLVSWSSNAPWRTGGATSSSSGGSGTTYYCDYGYPTSYGGGCVLLEDIGDCDLEWGKVVTSCNSRTDMIYCSSVNLCYSTKTSCDTGYNKVSNCPTSTICTESTCSYNCSDDYGMHGCR